MNLEDYRYSTDSKECIRQSGSTEITDIVYIISKGKKESKKSKESIDSKDRNINSFECLEGRHIIDKLI